MDPLVIGRRYMLIWRDQVYRNMRYVGRGQHRPNPTTLISGPEFESPDGYRCLIQNWKDIEIRRERTNTAAPQIIDGSAKVVS